MARLAANNTQQSNAPKRVGDFAPAHQFRSEMDRFFDRFLRHPWGSFFEERTEPWLSGAWTPALDLSETDQEVQVRMELPGVESDKLDLTVNGTSLTIRGEKSEDAEESGRSFHRVERRFGSFERTVELPQSVDENSITADHRNGILTIRAKKAATAQRKRIPIGTVK